MAYVNILSLPGVTYTIVYKHAAGAGYVAAPVDPITVAGGWFVIPNQSEWGSCGIEITSFGMGVLPMDGRIEFDNILFPDLEPYGFGPAITSTPPNTSGSGYSTSPASGTLDSLTDGTFRYFNLSAGTTGSFAGGAFRVLLDGSFPPPVFWTDFDGTYEDTELHKQVQLVSHPAVAAVAAVPPLEVCTPDPPEVPGPGGSGLGGSSSGPPSVDNPPPPGEPRIRCTDLGNGLTCCRDQNGNPIGSGCG